MHLLRSGDVNLAQPTGTTADGRPFIAAGTPRINTAFSTIELKSSDGDSWYNAFIFEVRRRWSQGLSLQSSYTFSKSEDTTQASTFFSDATNGTTSALPEFIPDYNRGPSDFDIRHNWVLNFTVALPGQRPDRGAAGAILGGWNLSGHLDHAQRQSADGVRDRPTGRARSGIRRAAPASARIGPTTRPATVPTTPCSASPSSGSTRRRSCCSRPARSATPAAATSSGRTCGRSTLALSKIDRPGRESAAGVEVRLEAFNVLNRANFGVPELRAFSGTRRPAGARDLRPHHQHGDVVAADSVGRAGGVLSVRGLDGFAGQRVRSDSDFVASAFRRIHDISEELQ